MSENKYFTFSIKGIPTVQYDSKIGSIRATTTIVSDSAENAMRKLVTKVEKHGGYYCDYVNNKYFKVSEIEEIK